MDVAVAQDRMLAVVMHTLNSLDSQEASFDQMATSATLALTPNLTDIPSLQLVRPHLTSLIFAISASSFTLLWLRTYLLDMPWEPKTLSIYTL